MLQVGIAWANAYREVNPDVTVTVSGDGSGTGIRALINGTVSIAQSSRAIEPDEAADILKNRGQEAVEHIVGYDGIAVFVHKENPVKQLSLGQLKGIFAEGGGVTNWNQVGGSDMPVLAAGRNNASGTYVFFRDIVCGPGVEFTTGITTMPGSTAVVDLCKTTPGAIGYSGMGYKTDDVGWLAISKEDGGPAFEPSAETVSSGDYPIARPLYIYTIGEPEGATKGYLDWIKSPEGQAVLEAEKFVPLGG
jgi:phosphate transport system substrate-binding protein